MQTSLTGGRAWVVTGALALFMMINFFDKIVLGLVAVPMMDELKLTPEQYGLMAGSFYWLFAIGGIAGGFLANRFSAKWLLFVMALLWSACLLPVFYSSLVVTIILCRVLLGLTEGPAWPVAVHALYKWFPDERRNLPVAILGQGSALGLMVAGLALPPITLHWGWRANFVVLAAIGLIWAVLWAVLAKEGPLGPDNREGIPAASRVSYRALLLDRSVLGCFVTHFFGYWSLALGLTWLPAYFQRGLGYDGVVSGRIYSLVVLFTIPLSIAMAGYSQFMLKRGASSKVARGRYLSCSLLIGGALFALVLVTGLPDWGKIGILAVGVGLTPVVYSLGSAILAEVVPLSRRGAVLAINNSVAAMAGVFAPALTGKFVQDMPGATGYEMGFALCGGLMMLGGILGFWLIDPVRSQRWLPADEIEMGMPAAR